MRRLKKILKWTAIVAGAVIAILLIINAVLVWTSGARLEKQLVALRAAGDPVSLAELAPDPVSPEENAAVFLRRVRDDVEAILAELAEVGESDSYRAGRPSESELKAIRSALEAYPDVIPQLERAAACPDYVLERDYTVAPERFLDAQLPQVGEARQVARVLHAHVFLLLSQGEREEALRTCILLLKLCRHFDREPMILGYLMSLACRGMAINMTDHVLRDGKISDEDRKALETELALHDFVAAYRHALKTERAYAMECYRNLPARGLNPLWNYDQSFYLELFEGQLALASRPYAEFTAASSTISQDPRMRRYLLAALVFPAVRACREAMERTRAQTRCLRVLNALQQHAKPGDAGQPALLDLGLPAEVTTDPFTGKPLRVKKLAGGWLVYSVGMNLKDDDGNIEDLSDFGLGPIDRQDGGGEKQDQPE